MKNVGSVYSIVNQDVRKKKMLLISELLEEILRPNVSQKLFDVGNIRFEKEPAPVVVWNINNFCNMTCPHCYASARVKPNQKELSSREALAILDRLREGGVRVLIFSGGEPLLRQDVFQLIEYAISLGLTAHLSTNGTLIDNTIAKRLKTLGVGYVGVSIDGLPEYNDSYRNLENGFSLALNGIKYCRDNNMKTGIRMTLTNHNKKYLGNMMDIAKNERIDRFYISHLLYSGRGENVSKDDLSKQETREFMENLLDTVLLLHEHQSKLKIVTGGNDVDGVYMVEWINKHFDKEKSDRLFHLLRKRGGNSAGEKMINVDHLGEVHPDQFWRNAYCGNLLEKSLKEILQGELITQLKDRQNLLKGKCSTCKYIQICRGSHRERALSVFKDLWAEDPSCYMNEEEI
jgi:Fe-coproporphyrin III synthase